jgi:hypothetical protein
MDTLPAARPVRMCTSGNAVAAAPSFRAPRRDIERFVIQLFSGLLLVDTAQSLASLTPACLRRGP